MKLIRLFLLTFLMSGIGATAPMSKNVKLVNGAPFDCEEDTGLVRSTIVLVYPGGGGLVPREQQGMVDLIEELLKEGPTGQTPEAFRDLLFSLNSSLSYRTGARSFQWILTAPDENMGRLLEIAEGLRQKMRWTADDFARVKDRILVQAKGMQDDMSSLIRYFAVRDAFRYFPSVLTGEGSPKAINNITLESAKPLAAKFFDRSYMSVYAVTPGSCATINSQVNQILNRDKGLPKFIPFSFRPMDPESYRRRNLQITLIDKPGATDHQVAYIFPEKIALEGMERLNATVGYYLLGGGGLSSRLARELREKRGLTYYAGTSLSPFNPYWAIMTFGGNEQIGPLLVRIPEVVKKFQKEKLRAGEISEIKSQIASDFLTARELSLDRLLERVGDSLYGIDPSFRQNYLTSLSHVSAASVKKFVKDKVKIGGGYLYLMGDKKVLLPILEKFQGAGPEKGEKVKIVELDEIL